MWIKKQNLKGVSLYIVLAVLSVLMGISLGLSSLFAAQLKIFISAEKSVGAFYAADTGIEKNLYQVRGLLSESLFAGGAVFNVVTTCNPAYTLCHDFCPDCQLDAACNAPRFCIFSTGLLEETKRKIEVKF